MAPNNEAAKRGQQEAQDALARLRQQLAEKAEQQSQQPPQNPQQAKESKQSFESMLAQVKEELKNREVNARPHAGQKYNEQRDRNLRNW